MTFSIETSLAYIDLSLWIGVIQIRVKRNRLASMILLASSRTQQRSKLCTIPLRCTCTHTRAQLCRVYRGERERERERDRCPRVIPSTEPRHFLHTHTYISRFPVRPCAQGVSRVHRTRLPPDTGWNRIHRVIHLQPAPIRHLSNVPIKRFDLINESEKGEFVPFAETKFARQPRETCVNFHRSGRSGREFLIRSKSIFS